MQQLLHLCIRDANARACRVPPVKSFQKGPPPEKAKLKRWWTYLSQFRLIVHHIPGIKNELSEYISRNDFDALIAGLVPYAVHERVPSANAYRLVLIPHSTCVVQMVPQTGTALQHARTLDGKVPDELKYCEKHAAGSKVYYRC